MAFLTVGLRPLSLAVVCTLFATIGSGCVPAGSDEFAKPVASGAGGADPVVLNGAAGKVANPVARTESRPSAAPGAGAAIPAAVSDSGAPAPGGPLFGATPVAPLPPTPAVAAVPPDPAGGNLVKNADGFPNVNAPVREPASKLLPEDERARVISELEQMRSKDGSSASKVPAGPQEPKKIAAKVKPVKCPDGTTTTKACQH
jgi:hypothetical protein